MGNAIYIVDPLTGERLWWASNTGSGATLEVSGMDFSIPSDLALMDPDGDGAVDRIYVGDVAGQIFRIDLSSTLKTNTSVGYRFADIACTAGTRPTCTGTAAQDRRKFFYPPDVTQVNDSIYEDAAQAKYDLVTIVSGDREDPLDLMTVGAVSPVQAVHNKIYAFRDYQINNQSGTVGTLPAVLTENDLYDASNNDLQVPDATTGSAYDLALNGEDNGDGTVKVAGIKDLSGWRINLWNPASALAFKPWLGEKGLAKTVIFDGNLYVTTFLPTNAETIDSPCSPSEGEAFVYSLNMLNGTAIMDNDGDGQVTTTDDRKKKVGGGIPSELVTVIREGGTTALVGTSGGAASPKIDSDLPRFKTYWYEE
jgi:type IV pilus assembly protein PilY1